MKAIFEETLGCVFEKTEPVNDKSLSQLFLRRYDDFRKALSPQKVFLPLDTNRFFRQPPEKKTNNTHRDPRPQDDSKNTRGDRGKCSIM